MTLTPPHQQVFIENSILVDFFLTVCGSYSCQAIPGLIVMVGCWWLQKIRSPTLITADLQAILHPYPN